MIKKSEMPKFSIEVISGMQTLPSIGVADLPFETEHLRKELTRFLNQPYTMPDGSSMRLGSVKWGVYAFYDYDDEPIYVGQTKEKISTRIRRHLTNQRTDAVAMNVLDPFEVHSIEVYPLPEYEQRSGKDPEAKAHLNALENMIFNEALRVSQFSAVLNEKDPPLQTVSINIPAKVRGKIVSPEVSRLRDHPDLRIARRAATLAKLAQVISERKVQKGLRRTLLAQARRLESLAGQRFEHAADTAEDED
jgi:hypothetical protein